MGCLTLQAQDPLFSQYQNVKIYFNPAESAIYGGISANIATREQWGSVINNSALPGTFRTQFAAVNFGSAMFKSSGGLYFLNDKEGDANLKTMTIGANYGYVLPLLGINRSHFIKMGFGVHHTRKSIDWDLLQFSDELHPKGEDFFLPESSHDQIIEGFRNNKPNWTGVNLGAIYVYREKKNALNGKMFDLGFGINHAANLGRKGTIESLQGLTINKLSPNLSFTGTGYFPQLRIGSSSSQILPYFSGRLNFQGGLSSFAIGGALQYQIFDLGITYQNTTSRSLYGNMDAISISFDFLRLGKLPATAGFSYDISLGGLKNLTGNTFELVFTYRLKQFSKYPNTCKWENVRNRVFHENPNNKNLN